MKYFSELTNKTYNTEEECKNAEAEYSAAEARKKELATLASKEKKELAKAVDLAEQELNAEYINYTDAKKKAEEIYKKANEEASDILKKAKERVRKAEQAKYEAISSFNKKYGAYTKSYSGEDARRELERSMGWINDIFDHFFF